MEREEGMGLIAISLTTRSETDFPIFNPKLNYSRVSKLVLQIIGCIPGKFALSLNITPPILF